MKLQRNKGWFYQPRQGCFIVSILNYLKARGAQKRYLEQVYDRFSKHKFNDGNGSFSGPFVEQARVIEEVLGEGARARVYIVGVQDPEVLRPEHNIIILDEKKKQEPLEDVVLGFTIRGNENKGHQYVLRKVNKRDKPVLTQNDDQIELIESSSGNRYRLSDIPNYGISGFIEIDVDIPKRKGVLARLLH